ncbi:MAG TPA: (2Fe-2S)-binding protein [Blastocatellia bacterium]|nr:(2Fe-2S)-binding protein [Blastocatellia bacterium]
MNEKEKDNEQQNGGISRRSLLKGMGGGVLATGILPLVHAEGLLRGPSGATVDAKVISPDAAPITLTINGRDRRVMAEPRSLLVDVLRGPELDLTGTKLVCDRGACGGCTVLVNDTPVLSCMTLALDAQGKKIETIEGLAHGDQLHPIQAEFVHFDALQCGYCTSGMIMSCKALLDHNPNPSLHDIKQATSGNLCRCGTYPNVFKAVQAAAKQTHHATAKTQQKA